MTPVREGTDDIGALALAFRHAESLNIEAFVGLTLAYDKLESWRQDYTTCALGVSVLRPSAPSRQLHGIKRLLKLPAQAAATDDVEDFLTFRSLRTII